MKNEQKIKFYGLSLQQSFDQFLLEHLKNERPMTLEDMKNHIAGRIIL